jgi:hypothetical protein
MNKIAKNIEASVLEFTRRLADKYDLDQDTLMEMWTDVSKMKTKASKAKKPPSAYQIFSAEQRALLKKDDPSMAFGDIAKEIGHRWKKLTSEEKAAYTKDVVKSPPSPSPKKKALTPIHSAEEEEEADLHSLSKTRLLEMCAAKGVKIAKSKSKAAIITAIQEADEADAASDASSVVMSMEASDDEEDNASVAASDNASEAASDKTLDEEAEAEDMRTMYEAMKPKDLVAMCKEKGVPSKGTKAVLIERLLAAV